MTQRRRDKDRGLLKPKQPTLPEGVGKESHRLDGRTPRSKTIFDSELYRVLHEVIEHALGRSTVAYSATTESDLETICKEAGLTITQWEVVAMRVEGFKTKDMAGFLEISPRAVQRRLERAKTVLEEARLKDVRTFV